MWNLWRTLAEEQTDRFQSADCGSKIWDLKSRIPKASHARSKTPETRFLVRLLVWGALSALAPILSEAQAPPHTRRVLPEVRADVVTGDVMTAHLSAGVHVTSGTYVRIAAFGGYGRAWDGDLDGPSYRLEIQGRFHLDPLRSTRFGLYGVGGVTATHDPFTDWQSRMVVGAGVELPAYARATLAVEAALAGGLRVSLAARRVPLGRR